jgi:predicted SAM-dependent methyltransferase
MSETSACRERLLPYCLGNGLDLGFGGDPISPTAVTVDLENPYTKLGNFPHHLKGDATNLYWFKSNVLDYVYSSHLLEDFTNTRDILVEWLRVLKPGGNLVLNLPNEKRFREHCQATGQPGNDAHKLEIFSLEYVKYILESIPDNEIIYELDNCGPYCFELVVKKL